MTFLLNANRFLPLLGIVVILVLAWAFSTNRRAISWTFVLKALLMQCAMGIMILKTSLGVSIFSWLAQAIVKLYGFADVGSQFLFGNLIRADGPWGFVFAVKVLPVIIFFSALTSLLFHLNIIQKMVNGIGFLIQPLLGTSGPETLCAVANSFLGQTESPLLIRNYLPRMNDSEMFVVMVSGMATISGSILAVYASMGVNAVHMLAASVMSIPGALLLAKMIIPDTNRKEEVKNAEAEQVSGTDNIFDAIAHGTSNGMMLALNIGAMLIAFLALLSCANAVLALIGSLLNAVLPYAWQLPELSFQSIMAYLFAPFGYLFGFNSQEAMATGSLLGTKIALNELFAYDALVHMNLSDRTKDILTYALCGFSNFSCIGIQIGALGMLNPAKRNFITRLGVTAVFSAALSNLLTAYIAALIL